MVKGVYQQEEEECFGTIMPYKLYFSVAFPMPGNFGYRG